MDPRKAIHAVVFIPPKKITYLKSLMRSCSADKPVFMSAPNAERTATEYMKSS